MSAFRLAGLMRVRQLLEEQAASELAHANHQVRTAEHAESQARVNLASYRDPHTATGTQFALSSLAKQGLAYQVEQAGQHLADAKMHAQVAHEQWTVKRRETQMLEKLHNRHRLSVLEGWQRDEQALLDELATGKAVRKEGHR